MSDGGFIEARLTLATAQSVSWSDGDATGTATVAAGSYWPAELASALADAFVALGSTTADIGSADGGRRWEIGTSSFPFSLTWTSTALRDALGFASNISGATTYQTGAGHIRGRWYPGIANRYSRHGHYSATPEVGELVTDYRATVSPTGRVHAVYANKHRRHRGIRWEGVPQARAKQHFEVLPNESMESFALDCMTGRLSLIPVNPQVRLTWSAALGGTTTGRLLWPSTFSLETLVRGWSGRYVVELPELVEEDT